MRLTSLAAALALSASAAAAAAPIEVMPAIPAGIAVTVCMPRFPDAASRRQADRAARARCEVEGGQAQFVRSALLRRDSISMTVCLSAARRICKAVEHFATASRQKNPSPNL
jgi:hypothetical protein